MALSNHSNDVVNLTNDAQGNDGGILTTPSSGQLNLDSSSTMPSTATILEMIKASNPFDRKFKEAAAQIEDPELQLDGSNDTQFRVPASSSLDGDSSGFDIATVVLSNPAPALTVVDAGSNGAPLSVPVGTDCGTPLGGSGSDSDSRTASLPVLSRLSSASFAALASPTFTSSAAPLSSRSYVNNFQDSSVSTLSTSSEERAVANHGSVSSLTDCWGGQEGDNPRSTGGSSSTGGDSCGPGSVGESSGGSGSKRRISAASKHSLPALKIPDVSAEEQLLEDLEKGHGKDTAELLKLIAKVKPEPGTTPNTADLLRTLLGSAYNSPSIGPETEKIESSVACFVSDSSHRSQEAIVMSSATGLEQNSLTSGLTKVVTVQLSEEQRSKLANAPSNSQLAASLLLDQLVQQHHSNHQQQQLELALRQQQQELQHQNQNFQRIQIGNQTYQLATPSLAPLLNNNNGMTLTAIPVPTPIQEEIVFTSGTQPVAGGGGNSQAAPNQPMVPQSLQSLSVPFTQQLQLQSAMQQNSPGSTIRALPAETIEAALMRSNVELRRQQQQQQLQQFANEQTFSTPLIVSAGSVLGPAAASLGQENVLTQNQQQSFLLNASNAPPIFIKSSPPSHPIYEPDCSVDQRTGQLGSDKALLLKSAGFNSSISLASSSFPVFSNQPIPVNASTPHKRVAVDSVSPMEPVNSPHSQFSDLSSDDQPVSKRKEIQERNRAAAVRYRQRKKEEFHSLQALCSETENKNLELTTQVQVLRKELERVQTQLSNFMSEHKHCSASQDKSGQPRSISMATDSGNATQLDVSSGFSMSCSPAAGSRSVNTPMIVRLGTTINEEKARRSDLGGLIQIGAINQIVQSGQLQQPPQTAAPIMAANLAGPPSSQPAQVVQYQLQQTAAGSQPPQNPTGLPAALMSPGLATTASTQAQVVYHLATQPSTAIVQQNISNGQSFTTANVIDQTQTLAVGRQNVHAGSAISSVRSSADLSAITGGMLLQPILLPGMGGGRSSIVLAGQDANGQQIVLPLVKLDQFNQQNHQHLQSQATLVSLGQPTYQAAIAGPNVSSNG